MSHATKAAIDKLDQQMKEPIKPPVQRIGAILSMDDKVVNLLGYGVYEGEEVPPEEFGYPAPNPKLKLDNGDVIWGMECWWGPEEAIKKRINRPGLEIKQVSIAEHRAARS